MNRLILQGDTPDSVLLDARLRLFQKFTTALLKRLQQLEKIEEQSDVEAFHKELLTELVEEQARSGKLFGDEPFLIACGIADEILQNTEWVGRAWWKEHLLELSIFGTRTIGDRFYTILQRIITERKQKDLPLAIILLDSLALGFRGRLTADTNDEAQRNRYRNELGTWIQSSLEQTYPHSETFPWTEQTPSVRTIPSLMLWALCAVFLAFGLLLISHGIWQKNIEPLCDFLAPSTVNTHSIIERGGR